MRATPFQQIIVSAKQALDPRRLATLDDAELLQHLLNGDPASLEAIMLRHGAIVTAAARPILKDAVDIEDVFQATFIVLLKSARKIQQGRSLGSWLYGVAHRLAVHAQCRKSKQQARERVQSELPEQAVLPDDLSWREATTLLHEELERMPERLRVPLMLCHLEGKSRDEVASELGVSVGAVKGLLERGRAKLKVRLEKRGIAFSAGLFGTMAVEGTAPSTAWVDSAVNAVVNQTVRPTVQQLVQGVLPMSPLIKMTLAASVLVLAGLFGVVASIHAGSTHDAPVVSKKDNSPPAKPNDNTPATFMLAGKIVGPDGKPLGNVPLFVPILLKEEPQSQDDIGVKEVGRSNADGTFRVDIKRSLVSRFLFAQLPDHAIGCLELDEMTDREGINLTIAKEFVIRGRVVDTEGKPIVGVQLRVEGVKHPQKGTLDDVLAEYKKEWQQALRRGMTPLFASLSRSLDVAITNKEGCFSIRYVPIESIAMIQTESPDGAKSVFHVVTREGFDPKPYNEAVLNQVPERLRLPGQPATLLGPKPDMVLPLGRVIEGTIVDDATGKPLAGVHVTTGDHFAGGAKAVSDKEGRYRLAGVRKQKQYLVHAMDRNDKDSRYLAWGGRIDYTDGYGPITHNIQLVQGVVVTGRLIDRETGKGVNGYIRSAPLAGNEYFEKKPGYRSYESSRLSEMGNTDGSFRLLVIPGKSVLLVQVSGGPGVSPLSPRPYLGAKPDPDHPKLFQKIRDDYYITTVGNLSESITMHQVVKVIDVPADAKEFKVDLYLERGKSLSVKVVDAEGKPVTKNVVSGSAEGFPFTHHVEANTFTVVALDPAKPRRVIVVNAERRIAGSVELKGTEASPVMITLQPLGTLTGRLIDLDGQPRVGVNVGPRGTGQAVSDLYRATFGAKADVLTDADGQFTLPLVLPDMEIFLGLSKGKEYYVGEKGIGSRTVAPGKTVDYGTIKTKLAQ